jgi:amidophosphoribosyltransferase
MRLQKNLDGGYAMAGLLGHGDAFVSDMQNKTSYYYQDDEIVVVA